MLPHTHKLDSNFFYKYQGAGNDFVLFEDFENQIQLDSKFIKQICNRNYGIGANGVLILEKSTIADLKMRIFNEDGSEATMCGNGLRSVVRHLNKPVIIETLSGLCRGEITKNGVKVTLPKKEIINSPILLEKNLTGHLVNTGTEHLVIFTDLINTQEILDYASNLRTDPRFKKTGVNVNLAKIEKDRILVRTFEKGVSVETLACGTGGGAVSLMMKELMKIQKTTIQFRNSELIYSFDAKDQIWMEGPAELIFKGTLCLKTNS